MDFRLLSNYTSNAKFTIPKPFFYSFMVVMAKQKSSTLSDSLVWMWICGDKGATSQIVHFAQEQMNTTNKLIFADYVPCQNERLEDRSANNRAAKVKVAVLFLLKKRSRMMDMERKIPSEFYAPEDKMYEKAGKYNELQYRITSYELRMEFYLGLIWLLCRSGDTIASFFGGGKLLCAAMMKSFTIFCTLYSDDVEDFKQLKTLAKTLDFMDFAHEAYSVDESRFPQRVRDIGDSRSRGKKKEVEVFDLELDEAEDIEPGEHVESPERDACADGLDSSDL